MCDSNHEQYCGGSPEIVETFAVAGTILLFGGAILIGAGLEKVPVKPVARLHLAPWATPKAGGLALRLDL